MWLRDLNPAHFPLAKTAPAPSKPYSAVSSFELLSGDFFPTAQPPAVLSTSLLAVAVEPCRYRFPLSSKHNDDQHLAPFVFPGDQYFISRPALLRQPITTDVQTFPR